MDIHSWHASRDELIARQCKRLSFVDMGSDLQDFFEATEMPSAGWWEALWPDPAGVLAAVGLKPDMEVVDLCSGDGWFTLHIAKAAHYVVAIDIDGNLLEAARRRLDQNGVVNCDFVAGDAYDIAKLVPRSGRLETCPGRRGATLSLWRPIRTVGSLVVPPWPMH
jgi:protein-L-isoaspartate O-methyltransferase